MILSDLLPPERVREIATDAIQLENEWISDEAYGAACINAAVPEIARAVLLEAAKRFTVETEEKFSPLYIAASLRQMAKEITDAK